MNAPLRAEAPGANVVYKTGVNGSNWRRQAVLLDPEPVAIALNSWEEYATSVLDDEFCWLSPLPLTLGCGPTSMEENLDGVQLHDKIPQH